MDWGAGSYERFAVELEPASAVAVAELRPVPGQKVLDLACGNGNAAIELARMGARVTGADPAGRLLELARERLERESLEGEWREAAAEELPFADDEFDALVSVFGVIFAEDPGAAAAQMRRVVRPGGTIVITAWRPEGGISEAIKLMRAALAEYVTPPTDAPERVDWNSPEALAQLLGDVQESDHELGFRAASARAWLSKHREHHPAWLSMRQAMPAERFDEVQEEIVAILERHDVGSGGFEVRSPYLLARAAA